MKTFLILSFHLIITSFLWAQAPQGIPYQAVMRNADGSVMASSAVSLTFKIHDGYATGTIVYQESHALTSNAHGLVSCVVGNGVVSQGNFASVNWGGGAKFLQVMVGSGATQVDLGTQQMLSVPYALHSGSADYATNAETAANGFSNVSTTGDTLYLSNGIFIIVPGISAANLPIPVIGQDYQGGKVAYIFQPGDAGYVAGETHGLIAAPQDLGVYVWGCVGSIITGADGIVIGTGAQNTVDIVSSGCGGAAAAACANLVLNGFDDWFLPSHDELQQLYNNRIAIGGFQYNLYWSSSGTDSFAALGLGFYDGVTYNYGKLDGYDVRAVRAF